MLARFRGPACLNSSARADLRDPSPRRRTGQGRRPGTRQTSTFEIRWRVSKEARTALSTASSLGFREPDPIAISLLLSRLILSGDLACAKFSVLHPPA